MNNRKFKTPQGTVVSREFTADYEQAKRFDKVKVGKLGVYFRDGLKLRCLPYDSLERVFLRLTEVNGMMCGGGAVFHYFRLVFIVDGKEYVHAIGEDESAFRRALEEIAAVTDKVKIGLDRPRPENGSQEA